MADLDLAARNPSALYDRHGGHSTYRLPGTGGRCCRLFRVDCLCLYQVTDPGLSGAAAYQTQTAVTSWHAHRLLLLSDWVVDLQREGDAEYSGGITDDKDVCLIVVRVNFVDKDMSTVRTLDRTTQTPGLKFH